MTEIDTTTPDRAGGAGAGAGHTEVDLDLLAQVGTGLGDLADTLQGALHAVDSIPLAQLGPVLGPVGADFLSALLDVTARHREVLGGAARVADAAGELVLATGRLYSDTDTRTAGDVSSAGSAMGA